MYWEALGLPGVASTWRIEELSKWIQWAETGITESGSENEAEIRYNLSAFWGAKEAMYPTFDEDERREANILDVRAHGLLFALDDGLIFSRSPNYWQYWKSFWWATFTGQPESVQRPDVPELAAEARQAALDASAGASIAGQPFMADMFSTMADNVSQSVTEANSMWSAKGLDVIPGGIKTWLVLGIGAAALYLMGKSK